MKIGILQCGHMPDEIQETSGDYAQLYMTMLDGHGFDFQAWSPIDMNFPAGPHEADGWLISGSRHGAYDDLPFIEPLKSLVRDIYAQEVPMVGVCFGHQIIAEALGGRVEKFSGGWMVGLTPYRIDGEAAPMMMNAWHQDQVTRVPDGGVVVGSAEFCENAVILYGNRAYTVQPHPEFTSDVVTGLIAGRGRGVVPDDLLDSASKRIGGPDSSGSFARKLAEFFKQPRG